MPFKHSKLFGWVLQGVKCPIYSYIFLYLEDSPIYSYIFLYLGDSPIYSYISGQTRNVEFLVKQILLISNMERCRIDHYWRNIFSMKMEDGKIKYKCLPELVKSALILPHGNADVERSSSVNTSVVTED